MHAGSPRASRGITSRRRSGRTAAAYATALTAIPAANHYHFCMVSSSVIPRDADIGESLYGEALMLFLLENGKARERIALVHCHGHQEPAKPAVCIDIGSIFFGIFL